MSNEGRDEGEGMEAGEDEALWTLLGRQRPPAQASPYFARRVLREVTLAEEPRKGGWRERWRGGWPLGTLARRAVLGSGLLSGTCAALLLAVTYLGRTAGPTNLPATPEAVAVPLASTAPMAETPPQDEPRQPGGQVQDVEVIADLDNTLQREESRLWAEDSARF